MNVYTGTGCVKLLLKVWYIWLFSAKRHIKKLQTTVIVKKIIHIVKLPKNVTPIYTVVLQANLILS